MKVILRYVFCVISVVCMIIIFVLSSANGLQSDQIVSDAWNCVASNNLKTIVPGCVGGINFSMRDWGHVYLFTALGMSTSAWMLFEIRLKKIQKKLTAATIICFLYSLFDEIHQIFVPGRSFGVDDLLYDGMGYIGGIIIIYMVYLEPLNYLRWRQMN